MADQRRIDEFLDLYKQLEDALEDKYRNSRRHYSSVVFEFARDDDSPARPGQAGRLPGDPQPAHPQPPTWRGSPS